MVINTRKYVIYSAVFGNYDSVVKPARVFKDVDYVLFTDQPVKQAPWRTVHVDWFGTVDDEWKDRRAARHFKAQPGMYMPKADMFIWTDMTHEVHVHPAEIRERYVKENDIALFRHELRDCVFQEASAVLQYKMDTQDNIDRQLYLYQKENYRRRSGLWETPGVVRMNTPKITQVGMMWQEMMNKYSSRDQISLPYVLDKLNVDVSVLPGFAGKCSDINNKVIPRMRQHTKEAMIKRNKKKLAGYYSNLLAGYSIPITSVMGRPNPTF